MSSHAMSARGLDLLRDPLRNRGTAFTAAERAELGLTGLLPAGVLTLELQLTRAYAQYTTQPTDLAKNTWLEALRDRNEILYYKLLVEHLEQVLPVVYDPTIGEAIERYSHEFARPRGVYLDVEDVEGIEDALEHFEDVDLIVATDAEEILGIGDWGANGMGISQGKLAIYTAAAGIDPARALAVMLDVGTDNEGLLNDPLYVGARHARVRGERYDAFIEAYVEAASRRFPHALLHFEDFGPGNARRILERYTGRACVFNDDMQGTGAITLAALLAAVRVSGVPLADQRLVVFGAGTAGVGIADQIRDAIAASGVDEATATRSVWLVDKAGLLAEGMDGLRDFQRPYARPDARGGLSLLETVRSVRPTILVGTSTVGGAFTEEIVRELAAHVERPIIFPLSNPTERIEAVPRDLVEWTDGRALIGTGTPWAPVRHRGVEYRIGQANNALLYPGLGLGTVVARARHVSAGMIHAAAEAVAGMVAVSASGASLLPDVADLRAASATVAVAVARQAGAEGLARVALEDPVQQVQDAMWQPAYSERL
jgi:malate dehydrogenase (oxaloacetate-decarboxylating)